MIYFDYNATHPPMLDIVQANLGRIEANPANPSGISVASQKNQAWLDRSRKSIASKFALPPESVRFCSTGTEATYWMVRCYSTPEKRSCILSSCEHDAMIAACEDHGLKIHFLPLDESGQTHPEDLHSLLQSMDPTEKGALAFISVIHASNETGVIQPLEELSLIARSAGIPFLSDCIQSIGKIQIPHSCMDAFLLNGHKLGSMQGCAAMVFAESQIDRIRPLFRGGLQEEESRAGTENLLAISNFADCLDVQLNSMEDKMQRLQPLHQKLEAFLISQGVSIAGASSIRLYNTTYAIFSDIEHMDFLLMGLDQKGIVCSTGSSCKSRTRQPSRVLRAMGFSESDAMQALRFSSGLQTTEQDFVALQEALTELLARLERKKKARP